MMHIHHTTKEPAHENSMQETEVMIEKDEAIKALLNRLTNPSAIRGTAALCYAHKRATATLLDTAEKLAEDAELFGCIVDDAHGTLTMAGFAWEEDGVIHTFSSESVTEAQAQWTAKRIEGLTVAPVTTKLYGIFSDETSESHLQLFDTFLAGVYDRSYFNELKAILA